MQKKHSNSQKSKSKCSNTRAQYKAHKHEHNIAYNIGKAVQLQAWTGPECSRKLRLPDFVTTAQDGSKVVSLTHRPLLPSGNAPGTHFC